MPLWLKSAGRFKVEHVPYAYLGGRVDDGGKPVGLLHTTEGSTIEGALSVFRQHYAPNFTVGPDAKGRVRVLQHAPLGVFGHALTNLAGGVETNRRVNVQIEIVGRCDQRRLWLPKPGTLEALVSLMVAVGALEGIPLRHPAVRRDPKRWVGMSGWVGHADAPENNHVDPGKLRWKRLLELCEAERDERLLLNRGGAVTNVVHPATLKQKPRKPAPVGKTATLKRRAKTAAPAACCTSPWAHKPLP